MKDEKETTAKVRENDPRRFAYMIAWRDKYIKVLQERLTGWEEKDALLCSLLHYALARIASEGEGQDEREVLIDKQEITRLLGAFECQVRDTADGYCVRFTKKQENAQEATQEIAQEATLENAQEATQEIVQEAALENAQESVQASAQESMTGERADGGEAAKG